MTEIVVSTFLGRDGLRTSEDRAVVRCVFRTIVITDSGDSDHRFRDCDHWFRWILARLRKRTFFDLAELNQTIWELLEELNNRPMQKLGVSRRQLWETVDRPALKPLPQCPTRTSNNRRTATMGAGPFEGRVGSGRGGIGEPLRALAFAVNRGGESDARSAE